MSTMNFEVNLQPIGKRVMVPARTNLLDAARQAGVELVAICGGEGVCSTCRVHPVEGKLSPPTLTEEAELTAEDLASGYRLACQAEVLSNVRVDIPPESFTTPQRLQLEGQETPTDLDPIVIPLEVDVPPAAMHDLRSDLTRLRDKLTQLGYPEIYISRSVAAEIPATLRARSWSVRLALRGDEVVAALPPQLTLPTTLSLSRSPLFGLAVDIGTTKLAAYLVNLETGETAAKAGAMNPQIAYGEDVISRITYANNHPDGALTLQTRLIESLNQLITDLCFEASQTLVPAASSEETNPSTHIPSRSTIPDTVHATDIVEAVIVGNTAMHHLFTGLPVEQLGTSPYVAAVSDAIQFKAAEIGLNLAAGAYVYLPPNIAGYVGADHVAMLLGARLTDVAQTTIALDIGTNTEISLFHLGKHWSCSCASGPAFEGAHIADGMRAAPGAIERVLIRGEEVQVHTIGGQAAVGICGSGILDIVAELLKVGLLDSRGVLKGQHSHLRIKDGKTEFLLVDAHQSGTGRDLKVSRQDINEIQLAKGAIRAGVELLLSEAGIQDQDIQQFIVAGAFGTYLDLESAIRIGMFPDLPRERFQQVGNAAGGGARKLLVSLHQRQVADAISREVEYVELATHPDFTKVYVKALAFR